MATRARGFITRLTPRSNGTFLRLDEDAKDAQPKDGYFHLELGHKNYNALFSLALAAAVNRWPITVEAARAISRSEEAPISYINVDWEAEQGD